MKVCVSSTDKNLDADIDPRFGRCRFFLIIDTETMNFDTISNEGNNATGGAGIQAAQTVSRTGVKVVITGNIGPNAFQTLQASGIKVITGAKGYIKDILGKYNRGELKETSVPNVGSHFGMGNIRG